MSLLALWISLALIAATVLWWRRKCTLHSKPPLTEGGRKGGFLLVKPPTFRVELRDAPSERWRHVIRHFKPQIQAASKQISVPYHQRLPLLIGHWLGLTDYAKEIDSIAEESQVDKGTVIALQLALESSNCTSLVFDDAEGHTLHMRTLDWDEPDLFATLLVKIDFTLDSKVIARTITFAGSVGVFTGLRTGGDSGDSFGVAIHYRPTRATVQAQLQTAWRTVSGSLPVSYLVREALLTCAAFEEAASTLKRPVISPCFVVLSGCHQAVRYQYGRARPQSFPHFPAMQTNHDLDEPRLGQERKDNVLMSRERMSLLQREAPKLKSLVAAQTLFQTDPVTNKETIFRVTMNLHGGTLEVF